MNEPQVLCRILYKMKSWQLQFRQTNELQQSTWLHMKAWWTIAGTACCEMEHLTVMHFIRWKSKSGWVERIHLRKWEYCQHLNIAVGTNDQCMVWKDWCLIFLLVIQYNIQLYLLLPAFQVQKSIYDHTIEHRWSWATMRWRTWLRSLRSDCLSEAWTLYVTCRALYLFG